ncbi:chitin synthase [Histoplasma capsulatum]|uniref:Chitin synthase n=1 Tax=Ajellomyces capsulatus TaxID=5037 RepID=A0A8A1M4R3_AJECA|nr:chitin synthase [Histoplasma capsulatum]
MYANDGYLDVTRSFVETRLSQFAMYVLLIAPDRPASNDPALLCEIFTIGGIPISDNVRKVCLNAHALQRLSHAQMIKLTASDALQGFTAIHLGAIAATAWILLLNAIVGFQLLDDGTPVSVGLLLASGAILFIGTGYIALDTGFRWTGHFDPSLNGENRNIGLYVLYLLFPLICLVTFFALEAVLVLRILGELRPLLYLSAAGLLFAIGQIFQFVISTHLCQASNGKINGSLFATLFTELSVGAIWIFWSSITEDDWPMTVGSGGYN